MNYPLFRLRIRPIPIFMYHLCSSDILRQHLEWLQSEHFHIVHLSDLVDYFFEPSTKEFPEQTVILTFDDAYQHFYTHNSLVLRELDIKATLCVPTGEIAETVNNRQTTAHWTASPLMIWDELRELQEFKSVDGDDLFEFIPHSVNHPNFNDILDSSEDLQFELVESRRVLSERLGIAQSEFFCLPFGGGDGKIETEQAIVEAGYKFALRANYRGEGWNRLCIPRWEVSCPPSLDNLYSAILGCL